MRGEASNVPLLEAPPMPLEYGVVQLCTSVTLQPLVNRKRDVREVNALIVWCNENLIALPPTAKIKKKQKKKKKKTFVYDGRRLPYLLRQQVLV